MSRPTVYFAHPISTYGSDQEETAIATLELAGFEVVNPSDRVHHEACGSDMTRWAALAATCDQGAAMPFADGAHGAGVGMEMATVLAQGKQVYEVAPDGRSVTIVQAWPGERLILDVESTRARVNPFRDARKAAGLPAIPVREPRPASAIRPRRPGW